MLRGGVHCRLLPGSFPLWQTIHRRFAGFRDPGMWETLSHHLVMMDRDGA